MKKRWILFFTAIILLVAMAAGGTLAVRNVATDGSIGAGIADVSLKNIRVDLAGVPIEETIFTRGAMPGQTCESSCYVWNHTTDGYPVYVRVTIYQTWKENDSLSKSSFLPQEEDDGNIINVATGAMLNSKGWLIEKTDAEQMVLYYQYPLKPGEKTTSFMDAVSFSTTMGNEYANQNFQLDVVAEAVQANQSAPAIAAEWGVFPEFTTDGMLASISETGHTRAQEALVLGAVEPKASLQLTRDNTFRYQNTESGNHLGDAFAGMAPGETRTLGIKIENQNPNEAAFYFSQKTLRALEEINAMAKGGAYDFLLSVGTDPSVAKPLVQSAAGGYDDWEVPSQEGLKELTALKDYQYFATLKPQETTCLYLTLHLEGEGMDSVLAHETVDSRGISEYQNALGTLAIDFLAYYGEPQTPQIVKTTEEKPSVITVVKETVPDIITAVKTGDGMLLPMACLLLALGTGMIVFVIKKRRSA